MYHLTHSHLTKFSRHLFPFCCLKLYFLKAMLCLLSAGLKNAVNSAGFWVIHNSRVATITGVDSFQTIWSYCICNWKDTVWHIRADLSRSNLCFTHTDAIFSPAFTQRADLSELLTPAVTSLCFAVCSKPFCKYNIIAEACVWWAAI